MKEGLSLGTNANLIRTEVHEFKPGTILQLGITRQTPDGDYSGMGGFLQAYAVRHRGPEFERVYKAGGIKEALEEAEKLSGSEKEKAMAEIQKYHDITRIDRLPSLISKLEKSGAEKHKEDIKRYKEELALAKSRIPDAEYEGHLNPGYDKDTLKVSYNTPKDSSSLIGQVQSKLAAINADNHLNESERLAAIEKLQVEAKSTLRKLSQRDKRETNNIFGTHADCQEAIIDTIIENEMNLPHRKGKPSAMHWSLPKRYYTALVNASNWSTDMAFA
jgi:hypothetical protein